MFILAGLIFAFIAVKVILEGKKGKYGLKRLTFCHFTFYHVMLILCSRLYCVIQGRSTDVHISMFIKNVQQILSNRSFS